MLRLLVPSFLLLLSSSSAMGAPCGGNVVGAIDCKANNSTKALQYALHVLDYSANAADFELSELSKFEMKISSAGFNEAEYGDAGLEAYPMYWIDRMPDQGLIDGIEYQSDSGGKISYSFTGYGKWFEARPIAPDGSANHDDDFKNKREVFVSPTVLSTYLPPNMLNKDIEMVGIYDGAVSPVPKIQGFLPLYKDGDAASAKWIEADFRFRCIRKIVDKNGDELKLEVANQGLLLCGVSNPGGALGAMLMKKEVFGPIGVKYKIASAIAKEGVITDAQVEVSRTAFLFLFPTEIKRGGDMSGDLVVGDYKAKYKLIFITG